MSQLVFDAAKARQLEVNYLRRDIRRRRGLVREALRAQPGERILDIGCGPGFYVTELAERVGGEGAVVGIDVSPDMLALAEARCAGMSNVKLHQAPATTLPVQDSSFDAALSVQVLEFVEDVDTALAEIHRALRPGGRLVVWDVDWSTLSWYSSDPARMARVLRAWEGHLSHPSLPRTLAARLRAGGFEEVSVDAHGFVSTEFTPESYGVAILPTVAQFVAGRDGVTEGEARSWADEQRELGESGRFFFACSQFCFSAVQG